MIIESAFGVASADIEAFEIKHTDGSETLIPAQQAITAPPFIHFYRWKMTETRVATAEVPVVAIAAACVQEFNAVYREGSHCAKLLAETDTPKGGDIAIPATGLPEVADELRAAWAEHKRQTGGE